MRNYLKFWFVNARIHETGPAGQDLGFFENEFIGRTKDDILDAFGLYAQSFQGTHTYTLTNLDAAVPAYLELDKDNIYYLFRLLSTAFSNVRTTWDGVNSNFSGTVPKSAFFTLFVDESPRDTWSHGE